MLDEETKEKESIWMKVLPIWQAASVLHDRHEKLGHRRRNALLDLLKSDNLWCPNLREIVLQVGQACESCAKTEIRPSKKPVEKPIVPEKVLQRVQIDFFELAEDADHYKYCMTVLDCYSKLTFIESTVRFLLVLTLLKHAPFHPERKTKEDVVVFLEELSAKDGYFRGRFAEIYHTDNGTFPVRFLDRVEHLGVKISIQD